MRAIFEFYTPLSQREGFPAGQTGAVNVVQRFGSALNLNVHLHALSLDGVYTSDGPFSPAIFHAAPKLEQGEIARLRNIMRTRILRLMRRRGHALADEDEDAANSSDTDSSLPFITAASIQGRIALGPVAAERLSLSPDGKVILELRRTWRDGTTHFVFEPLTFIERLAPLGIANRITCHCPGAIATPDGLRVLDRSKRTKSGSPASRCVRLQP